MDELTHVTGASFDNDVCTSTKPVLVDFYTVWCAPCKQIAPVLSEIARENASTLKVVKGDAAEEVELAARFGVSVVPTLILFKGGKIFDQIVGAVPKTKLVAMIEKAL